DTHLVVAGFLACVAYRGTRVDGALTLDRACTGKNCFKKCGFAALEWAHQCDAPWTRAPCAIGTRAVLSHKRLPRRPGGRTWFPGPVTLSSQDAGRLARAEIRRCRNLLLDETGIDYGACIHSLVDQALQLVPGDLTRDIGDIESRLRVDVISAEFDQSRRICSTAGIDITCDCCRRFLRFDVGNAFRAAIFTQ